MGLIKFMHAQIHPHTRAHAHTHTHTPTHTHPHTHTNAQTHTTPTRTHTHTPCMQPAQSKHLAHTRGDGCCGRGLGLPLGLASALLVLATLCGVRGRTAALGRYGNGLVVCVCVCVCVCSSLKLGLGPKPPPADGSARVCSARAMADCAAAARVLEVAWLPSCTAEREGFRV